MEFIVVGPSSLLLVPSWTAGWPAHVFQSMFASFRGSLASSGEKQNQTSIKAVKQIFSRNYWQGKELSSILVCIELRGHSKERVVGYRGVVNSAHLESEKWNIAKGWLVAMLIRPVVSAGWRLPKFGSHSPTETVGGRSPSPLGDFISKEWFLVSPEGHSWVVGDKYTSQREIHNCKIFLPKSNKGR